MSLHSTNRFAFVRQAALAALVALALLTAIFPLGAAAAAVEPTMACCMGGAGHCKSGLMTAAKAEPATEPKGSMESVPSDDWINVVAMAHGDAQDSHRKSEVESAGNRSSARDNSFPAAAAIARPCKADCGGGPAGAVRRPKPREIALNFGIGRMRFSARSRRAAGPRIAGVLDIVARQIPPRGPPIQPS